jgi:membrane protein DedA with SNARE-associated domain
MSLLERLWAYVTLGAMGSFWGEASPLLGGLAAHDRHLQLWAVLLAVSVGTWLGQLLFYVIGRWRGRWVRKRFRAVRPLILRSVAVVRRHPWRASLASRFAYGVRIALPIACGMGRIPVGVYAVGTAVSSVVWSLVFTLAGWSLGRATERLLGQVREFEGVVGAALVIAVLIAFLILRRRHVEDTTVEVLDRGP